MEARLLDVFSHHPKNGVTLVGLEPNDVTHEAAAEEDRSLAGFATLGGCGVEVTSVCQLSADGGLSGPS